nr:MAG TPA: hypothetical protein [Crassvirales sp.]
MSKRKQLKIRRQFSKLDNIDWDSLSEEDKKEFAPPVNVKDIKVVQMFPERRKEVLKQETSLNSEEAVEFNQDHMGFYGYKSTFNDGTEEYRQIDLMGKACRVMKVGDAFIPDEFWDRFERKLFFITPEMIATPTRKTEIHRMLGFIGLALLATPIVGLIAYAIRLYLQTH